MTYTTTFAEAVLKTLKSKWFLSITSVICMHVCINKNFQFHSYEEVPVNHNVLLKCTRVYFLIQIHKIVVLSLTFF